MKTLNLVELGMKDGSAKSDLGNSRLGVFFTDIMGQELCGDIGASCRYRFNRIGSDKKLKRPVLESENALRVSLSYDDEYGTWGVIPNTVYGVDESAYDYAREDVLMFFNSISSEKYEDIKVFDWFPLFDIIRIAGYREKNIINNLETVRHEEYGEYSLYIFTDNSGNTFEYESKSKRITG